MENMIKTANHGVDGSCDEAMIRMKDQWAGLKEEEIWKPVVREDLRVQYLISVMIRSGGSGVKGRVVELRGLEN